MFLRFQSLSIAFAVLLTAGCAVGPDFERPIVPDAKGYGLTRPMIVDGLEDKEKQVLIEGRDIPADWWHLFESESVNQLVEQAILANPDLEAAEASLRSARENAWAGVGSYLPSIDGSGSVTRQKSSGGVFGASSEEGSLFNLYNSTVGVSYVLDIWGGTRRMVEALDAQEDYARFQKEAAYLALTANTVTAAIQAASLQAQSEATQNIADSQQKQLGIIQKQYEIGSVPQTSVLAQVALVAQTRASVPQVEKALSQTAHLIDVLAGRTPGETKVGDFKLETLKLPQELPLTVSSKLLEQRPDIRAAEALLHAASANVGVATSNMLPQITLSAATGSAAQAFPDLFNPGTGLWSLGAGLSQPLFHGGTLLHKKWGAEAEHDRAVAHYKSVVLNAFQNVADVLRALDYDTISLAAQKEAEKAAADSLTATKAKYDVGAVSYPSLLLAEQAYQQAHISYIKAQATRYADTVALFQALGGGWWNKVQDE